MSFLILGFFDPYKVINLLELLNCQVIERMIWGGKQVYIERDTKIWATHSF